LICTMGWSFRFGPYKLGPSTPNNDMSFARQFLSYFSRWCTVVMVTLVAQPLQHRNFVGAWSSKHG
jgi:hypothetical protein